MELKLVIHLKCSENPRQHLDSDSSCLLFVCVCVSWNWNKIWSQTVVVFCFWLRCLWCDGAERRRRSADWLSVWRPNAARTGRTLHVSESHSLQISIIQEPSEWSTTKISSIKNMHTHKRKNECHLFNLLYLKNCFLSPKPIYSEWFFCQISTHFLTFSSNFDMLQRKWV